MAQKRFKAGLLRATWVCTDVHHTCTLHNWPDVMIRKACIEIKERCGNILLTSGRLVAAIQMTGPLSFSLSKPSNSVKS